MKDKRMKAPVDITTQAPMENLPITKRVNGTNKGPTSPAKGRAKKFK